METASLAASWILIAAPFTAFIALIALNALRADRKSPYLAGFSLLALMAFGAIQVLRYRFKESLPPLDISLSGLSAVSHVLLLAGILEDRPMAEAFGRRARALAPPLALSAFLVAALVLLGFYRLDASGFAAALRLPARILAAAILPACALPAASRLLARGADAPRPSRDPASAILLLAGSAGLAHDIFLRSELAAWGIGPALAMQTAFWLMKLPGPVLARKAIEPGAFASEHGFTEKERSILLIALDGKTNKEMAQALGLSESAVKKRLRSVFRKAGVLNRSQLIRRLSG
jgi:DNA-binding CsgD family transcriptional regulator